MCLPFRLSHPGKQGWQNQGVKRRGVAKLKVLEASFKLESVGRLLMSLPDWWVLTVLIGEREGP